MASLLVLNGPNLNLLGTREPALYGATTLTDISGSLVEQAEAAGHSLRCFQSNSEGDLIDAIHAARSQIQFIIINPAAYTHSSIALRDALKGTAIPFIETHLTNVHSREPFRRHSYFSDIAVGVIAGFGADSYRLALDAAIAYIEGSS